MFHSIIPNFTTSSTFSQKSNVKGQLCTIVPCLAKCFTLESKPMLDAPMVVMQRIRWVPSSFIGYVFTSIILDHRPSWGPGYIRSHATSCRWIQRRPCSEAPSAHLPSTRFIKVLRDWLTPTACFRIIRRYAANSLRIRSTSQDWCIQRPAVSTQNGYRNIFWPPYQQSAL